MNLKCKKKNYYNNKLKDKVNLKQKIKKMKKVKIC